MTRASVRILGGLLLMGAVLSSSSCATDPNTIYRSAIERALEGYAAVTEHIDGDAPQPDVLRALASGLRPVDLQGCPDDFRAAWLIHIQAAEAMAQFAESGKRSKRHHCLEGRIQGILRRIWQWSGYIPERASLRMESDRKLSRTSSWRA